MKKFWICTLTLAVAALAGHADAAMDKRYTIKSAIIEYDVSGVQTGKTTLYFDNYGNKEGRHREATTKFMGFSQTIKESNYIDGPWSYHYDPKTNVAMKMNYENYLEGMNEVKNKKGLKEFGEEMLRNMGGTKVGTKKIVDKTCDVWDISNFMTKTCIYKNSVPLEVETNMMGIEVHEVATSFRENVAIPPDMITVPKTAQIQEMEDIYEAQNIPQTEGQPDINSLIGNMPQGQTDTTPDESGSAETAPDMSEVFSNIGSLFGE